MGYRERIEKAVVAMFDLDRQFDAKLKKKFGESWSEMQDIIDYEGCHDIACDLLGLPEDNSNDYDYNNPVYKGKWPKGAYCRDCWLDAWIDDAKSGEDFIQDVYKALKKYAEESVVFSKPGEHDINELPV
jgi:hypothetical protein